jgi:hypothetical protein
VAMSQFYKFNTSRPNIIVTSNITPKIELYCPTKEWIFKFLLLIVELFLNAPLFFLYFPTCFSLCCICWMRQGHFTLDCILMIYHEIFKYNEVHPSIVPWKSQEDFMWTWVLKCNVKCEWKLLKELNISYSRIVPCINFRVGLCDT